MKTNEVPEKIYLQVCGDCKDNDCENCRFEDLEENVTWCKDKIFEKDIEYTRTDVFIEKACEWLAPVFKDLAGYYSGSELLDDFKKAMKGV